METSTVLSNLVTRFRTLTEQPSDFLSKDVVTSDAFKSLSKSVFDLARTADDLPHSTALRELLVGPEFDDEQVWQQLELDNRPNIESTVKRVATLLVQGEPEFFGLAASGASFVQPIKGKKCKLIFG